MCQKSEGLQTGKIKGLEKEIITQLKHYFYFHSLDRCEERF